MVRSTCSTCTYGLQAPLLQVPVLEDSAGKLGVEPAPAPVLSWAAFCALCEAPPLQACLVTLKGRYCVTGSPFPECWAAFCALCQMPLMQAASLYSTALSLHYFLPM